MVNLNEHKFVSKEKLCEQLCCETIKSISVGLAERGKASMLLAGGSSPRPLYEAMSNQELNWKNVYFAPTDERWVEPTSPESNERLIRETLMQNKAARTNYISLKSASDDPKAGQFEVGERLDQLPFPTDLVLLGMGEDGHIASLFPNLSDTMEAIDLNNENLCQAIHREENEVPRMTMTLNTLLNTKRIFLLFYGKKKLDVFNEAKERQTNQLPVSYLLHQNKVPIRLYWAE